jgi:EAL domain-containing protein (putative c-di-GMP-specific phosphodiesterase class I)
MIILHNISQTFSIKTIEINCTCSIGIAMAPRDGHDLDTLIKKADIAMYQSKDSGRNSFRFFDVANSQNMFEHLNLATSMRKALADNQFILYYQPKINLHDHSLVGFEALIRWQHPQYGFISPETFISLAESSGVIIQLGEWVINEACEQGKRWIDKGFKNFSIAVNVSSIQFKRGTIDSVVLTALEKTHFPPKMLELELTESLLIDDTDRLAATLSNLRAMGLTFSIDDFGTGYSNLGYLKKFEVSYLKIDQSFVRRMEQNPEDALIVKAIIQLSSSLGLDTIAEGVETESAANILRELGCKMAQGYLWSRPLPAREIERFWCDWCLLEQT